jgi:hypothetical protein
MFFVRVENIHTQRQVSLPCLRAGVFFLRAAAAFFRLADEDSGFLILLGVRAAVGVAHGLDRGRGFDGVLLHATTSDL